MSEADFVHSAESAFADIRGSDDAVATTQITLDTLMAAAVAKRCGLETRDTPTWLHRVIKHTTCPLCAGALRQTTCLKCNAGGNTNNYDGNFYYAWVASFYSDGSEGCDPSLWLCDRCYGRYFDFADSDQVLQSKID